MAHRHPHAALAALCVLLGAAAPAAAQSPDGRVKLGIETALFEYASTETSGANTTSPNDSTDEVTFGVAPARAGVDVGYGLADTLVLGTRILLVHSSTEQPGGQDIDATLLGIVPHLDYVFPTGGSSRAFLGPMVGFGVTEVGFGPATDGSAHLFLFGANFGAHIFAARGVSFDPRLAVSYAVGEGQYDFALGGLVPTASASADIHVIAVSALLGISAWL